MLDRSVHASQRELAQALQQREDSERALQQATAKMHESAAAAAVKEERRVVCASCPQLPQPLTSPCSVESLQRMLRASHEHLADVRVIAVGFILCGLHCVTACVQAAAAEKDNEVQALIAEASNLREAVHRLQLDKETSDTLMHGVLAMAGRDEAARKALQEDKGKLVIQLGYEQVRLHCISELAFERCVGCSSCC